MEALHRASQRTMAVLLMVLGLAVAATPAQAQIPPPEPFQPIDANSVNLQTGDMLISSPTISVGPKQGGLIYSAQYDAFHGVWRNGTAGGISAVQGPPPPPTYPYTTVTLMGQSRTFMKSSVTGLYMPVDDPSATLTLSGGIRTLTLSDGSQAVYDQPGETVKFFANQGQIGKLTKPNGEIITFTYAFTTVVSGGQTVTATRIQSITNNFGYQLHFDYNGDDWSLPSKVTALNNAIDACAPSAATCSYSRTWPSLTFGYTGNSERTVTDALGHTTTLLLDGTVFHNLTGIRGPATSSGQDVTVAFMGTSPANRVQTITTATGTWTYDYDDPPPDPVPNQYTLNTRVTEPALPGDTVPRMRTIGILNILDYYSHRVGRVGAVTDALGNTTNYGYGTDYLLLSQIEHPEHDKTRYNYDVRGNIWKMERISKSGSPINTTYAAYPTDCTVSPITPATCNKPSSVTDARGNVTDFTYDPTHGGVLTATSPAPSSGAVRPQTRTYYSQYSAWAKNGAGTLVQQPAVWLPNLVSQCATLGPAVGSGAAPCAGLADEVKSTIAYQVGSASAASNLLPVATSNGAGDGSLTATQTITSSASGDPETVDGPLPGPADTTRTYYNVLRQVTGVIGPDPDGPTGSLKSRATRTAYEADSQVQSVETGTADNQSDSGMATFTSLQTTLNTYDTLRRKATTGLVVGGVKQNLTQFGYYANNLPRCQTVRMNPATFGAPPADACALGTQGADGPDRITYTDYDLADRPVKTTSGYASVSPRVEKQVVSYSPNGKEAEIADGKGNRTTNEYDGFDRLTEVRYPNTTCCASSTTDYEEYLFDANDNRTSWRRRDGTTVAFTYDALNRVQNGLRGEAYAYDNLGRRTLATYAGVAASATFDALGRTTSETVNGVALSYLYDLAGNRGRITWPDGFIADYGYLPNNDLVGIYENGGAIVAAYGYDDLGRRNIDWTGPGTPIAVQGYYYNDASQLSTLAHWPSWQTSSAYDHSWTFAYNAAGQVKSRTISSATYDWSGSQTTKSYGVNGLNQMTSVGATALNYTFRGNLKNDGVRSYCTDLLNNLTSVWPGTIVCNSVTGTPTATLDYDPTGRLWRMTTGGVTTTFLYAGATLVAELNASGTVLRRYVPGPGVDEYPVWYEGSGIGDRRYLMREAQGSVSAVVTGASGPRTANTYDEYGVPAAGNVGRLQYTGQMWLPEVGLYHYKARAYSPTLGRFLQTDPIGYKGGLNWYAYTGNDPVNRSDTTGLDFYTTCSAESSTCGSQKVGDGSALVQGATDKKGNFAPTVVTSASLNQKGSGNTAYVNGTGVHISTSAGSGQGVFIPNTASATIKGDASSGWGDFTFTFKGSNMAHGVLAEGSALYTGSGGHAGMVSAINGLRSMENGPFSYPEDSLNPYHGGAKNYRFTPGYNPNFFNYGPSPHFPVSDGSSTTSDFHVDEMTGPLHITCAVFGFGC